MGKPLEEKLATLPQERQEMILAKAEGKEKIWAHAVEVMGSAEAAEEWMAALAVGLEWKRT